MLKYFENFLIILSPLTLLLVTLFIEDGASKNTWLFMVLVPQAIIAISLFFLKSSGDKKERAIEVKSKILADDQFISLYERNPIAYLTVSHNGDIVMFNPAAIKFFSASSNSLIGMNFVDMIFDEGNGDSVSVIGGKISSGITINNQEIRIKTVTGEVRWVSLSVSTYDIRNQRLVSLLDITQEKVIDKAKSEFVALATHQLRTPVAAIRWNLELLEKSIGDDRSDSQDRYLTKISRNTMRMIALINDFLSVSKLETGTFATKFEDLNLKDFFEAITDEFTEKISEKNLTLKKFYNPEDLVFKSDSRLLHIIVSNLVSNAVKYVERDGEVSLSYELDSSGNNLIINVADNGIGVPKNELGGLFTKFFRASNAQTQQAEGTGLGLYIVKQSVDKLGGVIDFVSAENEGASFMIKIPRTY